MNQPHLTPSKHEHQVVFYAYPKLVFAWPILLLGYLFYFIATDATAPFLGWVYVVTGLMVLLTMGVDVERNYAVFWMVVLALFFFIGRWLQDAKGFTFFGDIYRFFRGMNVKFDPGTGMAISVLMTPPFFLMFLWTRLQHKWRVTHNEFEHYSFGRSDDSLARGAKRIRTTYPDLFELLLAGAGTLVVYSASGKEELRRIPHVPFLFFIRKRIDKLMEATAVEITDMVEREIVETGEKDQTDEGALGDGGDDRHGGGDAEGGAIGGEKL